MKAAIYTRYGPPEVVSVTDTATPVPGPEEVLINIRASTVNRTDCAFRSAGHFVNRLWSGLRKPRIQILGNEFAGDIVAVGAKVTAFRTGDRVFGYDDSRFGGHAEYKTMPASGTLTTIPEHLDYEDVVAGTEGAHYALTNIRAAKVKAGDRVLVNGATGAIGSAAVQLLHYYGAHVIAVCATPHIELVKDLGAGTVVDYLTTDFTQTADRFDFIFDAVGKSSFGRCKPLLKKKGSYISTELGTRGENIPLALCSPLFGGRKVLFPIPKLSNADLQFLKERMAAGDFKPVTDRHYPLERIVEAHRYAESGQKIGNVIIKPVG